MVTQEVTTSVLYFAGLSPLSLLSLPLREHIAKSKYKGKVYRVYLIFPYTNPRDVLVVTVVTKHQIPI